MQLSIDGFVAGPNSEMDWRVWNWDSDLLQYVKELTDPVDTILLGRVLAQGFIPHWAAAAAKPESEDFERKMHETHKVVFSKTLESNEWSNTDLAKGNLAEEIASLKSMPGKDIIVYGGGNFVSNLVKNGLIDDYHFFINPTILGSGMPIFQEVADKSSLKLVHAKSFECGIVVLCYQKTQS